MEPIVRLELEQVERQALTASRASQQHREMAIRAAASHASIALRTLLHVGLISREEDAEWRERLGTALGDATTLQRGGFHIQVNGASERPATDDQRAAAAYTSCRDLDLALLAWVHHCAATEPAIIDALAAQAIDPERIRRACRL